MKMPSSKSLTVDFRSIAVQLRRPPLAHVLFDVVLSNPSEASHWLLIRDQLDVPWQLESATANGVEVYKLAGTGRVMIGHFHGTQSFLAVLLAPGAVIKVHHLTLSLWNKILPCRASVEGMIADDLLIGGEPAEAWFGTNPETDRLADVKTENGTLVRSRFTPDRSELPLEIRVNHPIQIAVDVPAPQL